MPMLAAAGVLFALTSVILAVVAQRTAERERLLRRSLELISSEYGRTLLQLLVPVERERDVDRAAASRPAGLVVVDSPGEARVGVSDS
jgi:hypothetical protein